MSQAPCSPSLMQFKGSENAEGELLSAILTWIGMLESVKKFSHHTLISYLNDVGNFLEFCARHRGKNLELSDMQSLELRDFRSWLAHRVSSGHMQSSNARAVSALKNLFRYWKKNGVIENMSIFSLQLKKAQKPLPKALSVTDAMTLLDATSDAEEPWIAQRDLAILSLLYGAGLRISEALSITKEAFPKSANQSLRIKGKGGKEAEIYLLPQVIESVQKYLQLCPYDTSEGVVFKALRGAPLQANNFRATLVKLRRAYNLPEHASPHSLRHSFATHLLASGGDIRIIQELLRHESIATTQNYTKVDTANLLDSYMKFKR